MRELNETENKKVYKKLQLFIGDSNSKLVENNRLMFNNNKVCLIPEHLFKGTSQIKRKNLISAGSIIGKFTKTGNFRITITALNALHAYAMHKVWIKASAEMNYLYGNNALKSHIQKLSESIPMNAGVFVYNHNNVLLGFGVLAVSPTSYDKAKGGDIAVLRQGDNGEYIRDELSVA